ncbi:DUF3313 family protein [Pseudomaricurvus sp. HS19]|uniref:DUF3313 family protein n=1 Tax=Pseudomaricurvus sp. HS19 TaxID=2692626 RepID=UPI00136AA978|nr:DUF3313 family protein [Pseudomaricurvus sp. HS19]MYM63337.1 DUF3313 family protein [Pseudomaricurvus sp. HS19]
MKVRGSRVMMAILAAGLLGACAQLNPPPPEVSHDGLLLVPDTKFAMVYRAADADFSAYRQVALAPCAVAFRKRWLQDQNNSRMDLSSRVTKKDMARIQESLGGICDSHFHEAMAASGQFTLVDDAQASDQPALLLKPAIVNLDINAPDTMSAGMSRSYTTSAGEMTLYLEIYDATTGAILARVVDRRKDPDSSRMEWSNSVTNRADADRIFRRWMTQLQEGLAKAVAAGG